MLDAGLECILIKFVDDTKLGGTVDSLEGGEVLQRNPDKSEVWAITNHMKLKISAGFCTQGGATLDICRLWGKRLQKGIWGLWSMAS